MPDVVIEYPIINSPFIEPTRHFRFSDEGITNEVIEARRISSYYIPIAKPNKKGKANQLAFETEWTQDRVKENDFINRVRNRVTIWRQGGYVGISKTTRHLLEYWANPEKERKLFFCQIEALEAAKEAAKGVGFDLLVVCGFAFDPHVSEEAKRYGTLNILVTHMNPDLAMWMCG